MTEPRPSLPDFFPSLLRIPNADRKELLFMWAALAEIGADPLLYHAVLSDYPSIAANSMTEENLTASQKVDLRLARHLARVRIATDECLRGEKKASVLTEALEAVRNEENQASALHPLLLYAVKTLDRTLHRGVSAFPEDLPAYCIESVIEETASTSELSSKKTYLDALQRLLSYAGAASARVRTENSEKLLVRTASLKEDVFQRLLASLAAHEAERVRITRLETDAVLPEFRPPYGPTSFHQALMFGGVRDWISRQSDLDLWPLAKRILEKTFSGD